MSSFNYLPCLVLALFAARVKSDVYVPCCPQCSADENEQWSYRGSINGPAQWGRLFPRDCKSRSQSPINIATDLTRLDENVPQLALTNYEVPIPKATMLNDGHTVQITPDDKVRRTIVVEGDEYDLSQVHFHWSLSASEGSEHTIDDEAYTMEVHFVHVASDGRLAVVAVFFMEYEYTENTGLNPIVYSLPYVMYKNDKTTLRYPLVLNKLLPSNPASIFRYSGSLTTPNCTEDVIWSVMPQLVPVGQYQMLKFRRLFSVPKADAFAENNQDCLIAPNYRQPQPLNGRQVYFSSD